MILVTATVTLQPGKLDPALAAARDLQIATQAEPGCLAYHFYQNLLEPNQILVFEQWDSEAALEAHFETAHMASFQRQLPGLIASAPVVTIYDVSRQRSL